MKNKLSDLNNYLFEELDRLMDDLPGEELEREIKRADMITDIAKALIESGKLALNVKKHLDEYGAGEGYSMPTLLNNTDTDGLSL